MERDLNPIRKWLVTPIMFVPLLQQEADLDRSAIIVANGSYLHKIDDYFSF